MTDTLHDTVVGAFLTSGLSSGAQYGATGDTGHHASPEHYLAIIAPVNEVVAIFNGATDDGFKAQTIHALSLTLGLVRTEIERANWPVEAQEAGRRLVAAADAAANAADVLLNDLTDEAAAGFAVEMHALTIASSRMRGALGLPTASSGSG